MQSIVIAGGNFQQDTSDITAQEVVTLLLDDDEVAKNVKQLEARGKKRGRKPKGKDTSKSHK
jgi:hypothetical protein